MHTKLQRFRKPFKAANLDSVRRPEAPRAGKKDFLLKQIGVGPLLGLLKQNGVGPLLGLLKQIGVGALIGFA